MAPVSCSCSPPHQDFQNPRIRASSSALLNSPRCMLGLTLSVNSGALPRDLRRAPGTDVISRRRRIVAHVQRYAAHRLKPHVGLTVIQEIEEGGQR